MIASHGGSLAEVLMPLSALSALVATTARSVTTTDTDGELLRRFVRFREEPAFAALVNRLGPMVLGVCRRVTRDAHLADDAFQAAFVVLARRAGDVRPAEAVRGWLYGVAVRTAREARTVSARRLRRETPVPALPDRPGERIDPPDADALAVLDEEVAGLPEHLRVAVVLCELDGRTRRAAAEQLAIAEGTLSSRLAKARKLLAERLKKRGVALPAAGLAALAPAAPVSAGLAAQTSALASADAPLPPVVAALSNGVFRTMFLHKLTLGSACALLVALAGLATATRSAVSATEPPKPAPFFARAHKPDEPRPPARPAEPGSIIVARKGAFWIVTPDGKDKSELALPEKAHSVDAPALAPDGKRVAFIMNEEAPRPIAPGEELKALPLKIVVKTLGKEGTREWELPAIQLTVRWTADGKKLVASKINNGELTEYECVVLNPETGKTEALDLPANVRVLDCAKDGKTFLVQTYDAKAKKSRLGFAKLGDKDVTVLCDLRDVGNRPTTGRFSPDGKTVLFIDANPDRKDAHKWGCSQAVYVIGMAEKKREPLAEFPENGRAWSVAWSPGGKKIAYTWTQLDDDLLKKDTLTPDAAQKETEGFLMVADASGKNAKTVASEKGPFALALVLGAIDWR
jgi:RNA polymerase sigma factor (sigma-70 family)